MSTCPSPAPSHTYLQRAGPPAALIACHALRATYADGAGDSAAVSTAVQRIAPCTASSRPLCSAHFMGSCMSCVKDRTALLGYIVALRMVPLSLEQMPSWCAVAV